MTDWKEFLEKIYFNIGEPGSFSGPKKIQHILMQNGYNVKINNVKQWLQNQDSYSLFKPVRYRFKRDRVITCGIDDMWDVDLADVSNIGDSNNGYKYLLTAIDVFSRYLWIMPIKSKNKNDVKSGFIQIFSQTTRRPRKIRTDKGKEFVNKVVRQYMKSKGVKMFTTKNETKANFAERVIRTVKGLLYRYFLHKQTYRYVEILQSLAQNYNRRAHKSLNNLSPSEVNLKNEHIVWKRMYVDTANVLAKKSSFRLKIGDKVRISHLKYTFQRDYHQKWTEEYFVVRRRSRRGMLNVYFLKDLQNEEIEGLFYEAELQKVEKDPSTDALRIEKVLKRRRRRGKSELFVKWMGWPKKFNSWVDESDVKRF